MQPAVINIFEKAVKKAGKILLRDFGELENLQIQSKSVGDFVTNADIKVEKTLLETLKYYYPKWFPSILRFRGIPDSLQNHKSIIFLTVFYTFHDSGAFEFLPKS